MKILLDTHALLWWLVDSDRLGPEARDLIADPAHDILVSVVSLWEIAVKIRIGKLEGNLDQILKAVERDGFTWLAINSAHLQGLMALPQHHRDPFDHLLIAQAIAEDALFMSEDGQMAAYPVRQRHCSI
ncbi:type II toxin-antitoxin system VapC family toxin [Asaia lannensis]|uniref:PIN domain-containing protein n=2 Tax=Asaia TaxID=91914 RepID=A0A060QFQ0_9PROT|nr:MULTISPECIES: type II toxin-antitoxin system VapC family toxin [Asaia]ETC98335.1 pilus retraction motor protein PilT [Asaia sp. SF2.1]MCO6158515.1 type II toxin-antitoxin system VapC family toxin [Asaia lannensis NBRC 102526]GBR00983.1 pilus retraction motor protein PilT [Asaia lannensis NBRC 102526]CDG38091.1 hypothetical protein ASAP_0046 [Asaia bogorensis]